MVGLTLALWHFRFAAVTHPLNGDAGFSKGLHGWEIQGGVPGDVGADGRFIARFTRAENRGPTTPALRWLGRIPDLRFLRVRSEVRWTEVVPGGPHWAKPRLVLVGKTPGGQLAYPRDHAAFLGEGTRGWHVVESVYELIPEMPEIGLAFQMFGPQGTLEVRSLELTALRQRPWVPAATGLLMAGWLAWLTRWLRTSPAPAALGRGVAAAALLLAASWYLILPGARLQFKPLVGSFITGEAAPFQPPSPAPAPPAPVKRRPPAEAPVTSPSPASEPRSAPTTPPAPETRQAPWLTELVREFDIRFRFVHLAAFAGLSLASFIALGSLRPRGPLAAIAFLSELINDWHNREIDWGDLLDLFWNLLGILLGLTLFAWGRHRLHCRKPRPR